MTMIKNLKEAFNASEESADRGTLVETVLLVAGMAVIAILVVTWIGGAIAGAAADTAECITSSNTYASADNAQAECADNDKSQKAKEKNEESNGWQQRFG